MGSGYTDADTVAVPAIAAGTYYLILQSDVLNWVSESSESNNTFIRQIAVTNLPPSITLTQPTNAVQQTSCIPVSFRLAAATQAGSYPIQRVEFFPARTRSAWTRGRVTR